MKSVEQGLELPEYLNRYKHICYTALEKSAADYSKKEKMLEKELMIAEEQYVEFVSRYKENPSVDFLSDRTTDFLINRAIHFENDSGGITKEEFVDKYIQRLKEECKFSSVDFVFIEDYDFILSREKYLAEKYFDEQDELLPVYEENRISVNRNQQRLGFSKLKEQFEASQQKIYNQYPLKMGGSDRDG